ncbi:MAG: hypothetical protein KAT05_17095 [Spirochaetes bacterium]|nr:hypothetical protein [Spirochaetota bacterium]
MPENWKPFEGKKISEILEHECYECETHLFSEFETNGDTQVFLKIDIFFIDIFAMFVDKYKYFASRLDDRFFEGGQTKCCFFLNYVFPKDVQDQLEEVYKSNWHTVSEGYKKGALHRIVARIDDLKNFKNIIQIENLRKPDGPNLKNNDSLDELLGEPEKLPTLW